MYEHARLQDEGVRPQLPGTAGEGVLQRHRLPVGERGDEVDDGPTACPGRRRPLQLGLGQVDEVVQALRQTRRLLELVELA